MKLVCPCMNVTINVVVEDEENFLNDARLKLENLKEICDDEAIEDDFFGLCARGTIARFVLDSENGIVEKVPVLMKRRRVDRWEIRKCILCKTDAYALGTNCAGQVLVNMKLFMHEETVIAEQRKSAEISPVFQVILPKTKDDVAGSNLIETNQTAGNRNGFNSGATTVISRGALHAVQACVGQYLRKEQESMEERIRQYTEQQQAAFDHLKADAKLEKVRVLSILAQNGGGIGAGIISFESYWSSGSTSIGGTTGIGDEEFDSAVPLSPLSLASGGDPSPCFPDGSRVVGGSFRLPVDAFAAPLRPKAHSNPASLTNWKRKRHSGGPGLAPSLSSHPEEQQDVFSFEEQEIDELNQTSYLPADDEGDTTDDSGTGEDYSKYYPMPPPPPTSVNVSTAILTAGQPRIISSSNRTVHYAASVPVRVPEGVGGRWSFKNTDNFMNGVGGASDMKLDDDQNEDDDFEETTNEVVGAPRDVGASMQALARSIQSADDPERLFGERPQRRRWKTGGENFQPQELFQHQAPQNVVPIENRRKATVVVLFKEEQNF